jgi:hypothetical protein
MIVTAAPSVTIAQTPGKEALKTYIVPGSTGRRIQCRGVGRGAPRIEQLPDCKVSRGAGRRIDALLPALDRVRGDADLSMHRHSFPLSASLITDFATPLVMLSWVRPAALRELMRGHEAGSAAAAVRMTLR